MIPVLRGDDGPATETRKRRDQHACGTAWIARGHSGHRDGGRAGGILRPDACGARSRCHQGRTARWQPDTFHRTVYQDPPDPEGSLFFWQYNRGKRSVVLDLDGHADRNKLRSLLIGADVLLESMPKGRLQ